MKRLNMILVVTLITVSAMAAFTDIDSPQYYGKINIPKAYAVLDANFADAESRIASLEGGSTVGSVEPGYIIVGNASTQGVDVAVSGDITMATNGVVAIAAGVIVDADVNASAAIASTKLSGVAAAPAVAGSVSGTTNTVTITAKDGASATIAAKRLVRVWMSESSGGVPSTNNIESVTLSGGAAIQTITAAADYVYLTAATGIASAEVIGTAAGTNYINVADGGYVTSAAVVFE